MASGKPVVAFRNGGPAESIVHGHTGILCDPNVESFANAMCALVDDTALHARCAANARPRAEQFGWEAFVERIDSYLEELVGDAPAVPLPEVQRGRGSSPAMPAGSSSHSRR
jgi:alpha-1,3/alpha-1,6-mannosyltransferase